MANNIQVVLHLLGMIGEAALQNARHYIANPGALINDIINYARNNPWRFTFICAGIGLGIASFALPPLLGFAAAGPVLGSVAAGWQASIGVVAAGSAFAVIQSMAMTGTFTAIGGTLIGVGAAIPVIT
ncbi:hypothetical protein DFP73DRAFT_250006 [Morchella snyderi]|nr:hypothetical protein DFP73DRAFT_250006 [Morchella snyderi]